MVRKDDGTDVWAYEGKEIPNIGLNAVAGRPPEEYGMEPTSFDEIRAGCYDIHERVRDMDANGVLGSMCFPSFPNLCGQLFARSKDKDAAPRHPPGVQRLAHRRVVRHVPRAASSRSTLPPIWDPRGDGRPRCAACAAKGCHAVSASRRTPRSCKLPSFHADHWDPFWPACCDEGTIVCLHIGSSSTLVITADGRADRRADQPRSR